MTNLDRDAQANLLRRALDHGLVTPQRIAVVDAAGPTTYGQLLGRAAALADGYRRRGVGPGDAVAVLASPGRDAIASAIAALWVDACYVPIDAAQPANRVREMLRGCEAPLCVAVEAADASIGAVAIDAIAGPWGPAAAHPLLDADLTGDQLAYIVHTSGSTGVPKGVAVAHASVTNLLDEIDRRAPVPDGHVASWWCSPDFDVAVWEIWSPLCRGGTVVVVPPEVRWEGAPVAAFLDRNAVVSAYVPPAFLPDLLSYAAADPASLGALRRLLVGVEPIPLGLLQRLLDLLPELTIVNGYGPAEATICCTLYVVPRHGGIATDRTPIGTAVAGNRLLVVGPDGQHLTEGVGELVVSGAGLARGYVGAAADADRFVPDPAGEPPGMAYRTGDLVRLSADGCLTFVARADHQLKVRGYRIEPGEVENAIRTVFAPRDIVVGQRTVPGVGPALVGYVVPYPGQSLDPVALRGRLLDLLPAYAVPTTFMVVDSIPVTANGKTDYHALAAVPLRPDIDHDPAPRTNDGPPVQNDDFVALVHTAWHRVLGGDVAAGAKFVSLGGTSLGAVQVAAHLRQATGRTVTVSDVLNAGSAAELGSRLASRPLSAEDPPSPQGRTSGPLNLNQVGIWIHEQMTGDEQLYVESLCFMLPDTLDEERLAGAAARAAAAHSAFGSAVDTVDGEPTLLLGRHQVTMRVVDLPLSRAEAERALVAEALRPFDLEQGPLMRCTLLRRHGAASLLLLSWHHLILDGWSGRLFLTDLEACYRDPDAAPEVAMTLCDANVFLLGRGRKAESAELATAAAERLRAVPLVLPTPAAAQSSWTESVIDVDLHIGLLPRLWTATRRLGLPLSAFVGAAYQHGLSRVLGFERFVMGYAVAGRERPEFARVAGYFVDTVLLRSTTAVTQLDVPAIADMAAEITAAAEAQEGVSLGEVVAQLRGMGRDVPEPMPQLFLSVDEDYRLTLNGEACPQHRLDVPSAHFDVGLVLRHADDQMVGSLEFRTHVMDMSAAERFTEEFTHALTTLVDHALAAEDSLTTSGGPSVTRG